MPKLLGFKRDENATGTDRTRKWRFTGTDDTESAQESLSAEKPRMADVLRLPNTDTQTHRHTDTQTNRAVWISEEKA